MIRRWCDDLVLGMRLALSGGGARTALVRLALTAAGVGLGVAVLLTATSVPHLLGAREDRAAARAAFADAAPAAGVDPVYLVGLTDEYRGRGLQGFLLQRTGARTPAFPGVDRLPRPGEAVLSPALADLLASPEGAELRPRFPQRVIGGVGDAGLTGPNELYFYLGSATAAAQPNAVVVSRTGGTLAGHRDLTSLELLLVVLGATTCLVPVFVFVATSTRLAAASRDRRLAALRLVGADRGQIGRIAAGEAVLGAVAGLVVGGALFLLVRALVPLITVSAFRGGVFGGDVVPDWRLGLPVVVLLPVLACAVAVFALRRVVIEPLGVVRRGTRARRALWWRALPAVVGGVLLVARSESAATDARDSAVVAGVVLILIAVPLVLPWLVERITARLRGGSPAWLLAVRRLQLDGATAARLVSGIAVVLAGSIALQGVYARAETDRPDPGTVRLVGSNFASSLPDVQAFTTALRELPGARDVPVETHGRLTNAAGAEIPLILGSCAELRSEGAAGDCRDGDVFAIGAPSAGEYHPAPGDRTWFDGARRADPAVAPQWTVPVDRFRAVATERPAALLVTPGALATATSVGLVSNVTIPAAGPDLVEQVRNAVGALGWNGIVYSLGTGDDGTYALITRVLSVGSILVLLFAAGSLMIAAWEQLRERRRSLAALMANGVGRGVLARSLLWQMAIPVAVAVVIAVLAGLVLDWLLLTLVVRRPMVVDVPTILALTATAAVAVLGVTAATLPALWRTASLEHLREE
ncbi:ABC transporter permease [Amycolatopsis sp. NBC_00355]|uniref:FtsX-like permease family protein n=1 Tax=Amycolatopsis sp. NBC_00355 TaxID=2975957 RepID=UPI002E276555